MKSQRDYIKDIQEMRTMMERSSKFLSLSGLAGIMAGIYALAGVFIAYKVLQFDQLLLVQRNTTSPNMFLHMQPAIFVAVIILILTLGTAIFLSTKNAAKRHETPWNATAKRLLINMAIPLGTGGILILIFIAKGLVQLIIPCTLIFYGLALFCASKFTYTELRSLGLLQVALGLICAYFDQYGLTFWALGFGVLHIVYGLYMHYRYER